MGKNQLQQKLITCRKIRWIFILWQKMYNRSLGYAFEMGYDWGNNCPSEKSILQNYRNAPEGVLDHHNMTMDLIANMTNVNLPVKIPPTLAVRLNEKNIHDVEKTLFETYIRSNDKFNPYQLLRDSTCFGLIHDATCEVNTVFIRAVSSDGHICIKSQVV